MGSEMCIRDRPNHGLLAQATNFVSFPFQYICTRILHLGRLYESTVSAAHVWEPAFFLAMLLVLVPKLYLVDPVPFENQL